MPFLPDSRDWPSREKVITFLQAQGFDFEAVLAEVAKSKPEAVERWKLEMKQRLAKQKDPDKATEGTSPEQKHPARKPRLRNRRSPEQRMSASVLS